MYTTSVGSKFSNIGKQISWIDGTSFATGPSGMSNSEISNIMSLDTDSVLPGMAISNFEGPVKHGMNALTLDQTFVIIYEPMWDCWVRDDEGKFEKLRSKM